MAKKSLIEAVKKLLNKLGAEEVESNDLVEVIDKSADKITSNNFITYNLNPVELLPETQVEVVDHGHGEIYGNISFNQELPNTLTIIFDGQRYENISVITSPNILDGYIWGDEDYTYTTYPFLIFQDSNIDLTLNTSSVGTHTIQIYYNPANQQLNTEINFTYSNGDHIYCLGSRTSFSSPSFYPDIINVEFDNIKYTNIKKIKLDNNYFIYGEYDDSTDVVFTNYPFAIGFEFDDTNSITSILVMAETAGDRDHSIKITASLPQVIINDNLREAVLRIIQEAESE